MSSDVGEYLEEMRKRHPRLSRRQMSLKAGLGPGAIQQLVEGSTKGRPDTLKAICDQWGTNEDYRELMRLAGHPLPDDKGGNLTSAEVRRLEKWKELSPATQKTLDWLIDLESQEPTLTEMRNAIVELFEGEQWKTFRIALQQALDCRNGV